jgi:hypothetical protein
VGQESNLHPAVVEFASIRPPLFTHVHHIRVLLDFTVRSVFLCPPLSLWVVVRIVVTHEPRSARKLLACHCLSAQAHLALKQRSSKMTCATAVDALRDLLRRQVHRV